MATTRELELLQCTPNVRSGSGTTDLVYPRHVRFSLESDLESDRMLRHANRRTTVKSVTHLPSETWYRYPILHADEGIE
jgi:hypothetical protein